MRFAEYGMVLAVLLVVAVVVRMLRAIRLLDARLTLLQEQVARVRGGSQPGPTEKPASSRPVRKTIEQYRSPTGSGRQGTPAPVATEAHSSTDSSSGSDHPVFFVDQEEADAVWAKLAAEQERLKKAMGKDFQARPRRRSASDVRGVPVLSLSSLAARFGKK